MARRDGRGTRRASRHCSPAPGAFDGSERRLDWRGDLEERRRIVAALDANGWRRHGTAACLGISRKVLWEKMRKSQIADNEAEPA